MAPFFLVDLPKNFTRSFCAAQEVKLVNQFGPELGMAGLSMLFYEAH